MRLAGKEEREGRRNERKGKGKRRKWKQRFSIKG